MAHMGSSGSCGIRLPFVQERRRGSLGGVFLGSGLVDSYLEVQGSCNKSLLRGAGELSIVVYRDGLLSPE